MSKLKKILNNPYEVIAYLENRNLLNWVSDKLYIHLYYRARIGEKLNLKNPVLFNEKLQWLKLNDRKEIYTNLVDKYKVRSFISESIGDKYLIPLIGVWKDVNDIKLDSLPNEFVLKCTHDSGGVFICRDKSDFNFNVIKSKIKNNLKINYFYHGREWPYKNVKPRVICEKLMLDSEGRVPKDYKFFCFNGEPKLIQVDIDRFDNHKQNFYDVNWNFRDINIHCENDKDLEIDKPKCLDEMIEICKKLSKNIPHVRIDLYEIDGNVFFGEITFFHMSGLCKFKTKNLNKEMGDWINIKLS